MSHLFGLAQRSGRHVLRPPFLSYVHLFLAGVSAKQIWNVLSKQFICCRRETACPVDNMKLEKEKDIFPDNFTRREINQQRTKCPNIVRGCMEELAPLDIEVHLMHCKFKPPELPENEKLRCQFVEFGCEEKFEDEPELKRHLDQDVQKHLAVC